MSPSSLLKKWVSLPEMVLKNWRSGFSCCDTARENLTPDTDTDTWQMTHDLTPSYSSIDLKFNNNKKFIFHVVHTIVLVENYFFRRYERIKKVLSVCVSTHSSVFCFWFSNLDKGHWVELITYTFLWQNNEGSQVLLWRHYNLFRCGKVSKVTRSRSRGCRQMGVAPWAMQKRLSASLLNCIVSNVQMFIKTTHVCTAHKQRKK